MSHNLFQHLYSQHSSRLLAYLIGKTGDKELSLDMLQDVYLKIWSHIDKAAAIREEERLYWMLGIAANQLKDYYRKTANGLKAEGKLRLESGGGIEEAEPARLVAERERFRELEGCIAELPESLRGVLVMKVVGGMNSREIGRALGIPSGTVRYRLTQARHALSAMLRQRDSVEIGVFQKAKGGERSR